MTCCSVRGRTTRAINNGGSIACHTSPRTPECGSLESPKRPRRAERRDHDAYLIQEIRLRACERSHRSARPSHLLPVAKETSLLRAYLTDDPRMRILFCMSRLHYDRPEVLREVFPEYCPALGCDGLAADPGTEQGADAPTHFPSSICLQRLTPATEALRDQARPDCAIPGI